MLTQAMQFVSGLMKPATDLIDEIITTDEERLQLQNTLKQIETDLAIKQTELIFKQMELEKDIADLNAKIVTAETTQGSWLSRSWRPITMLVFVIIIVAYVLGWVSVDEGFAREFLDLVKIGLGGYVIGRSAEKASASISRVISKNS